MIKIELLNNKFEIERIKRFENSKKDNQYLSTKYVLKKKLNTITLKNTSDNFTAYL